MVSDELRKALSEPFQPDDVSWKPQAVKGNRALAIAYIDARNVMDRLDSAVGVENWQDQYELLPDGSVMCRLSLKIADRWLTKTDVGGPSEQPDGGDRLKAAFSDALKRAAVKWGIGRYLYNLPHQWCDYDPQKRQFTGTPRLPDWAIPGKQAQRPQSQPAAKPTVNGSPLVQTHAKKVEEAETIGELSVAWTAVNADYKAKRLSDHEYGRLNALKDSRKRRMAGAAPGETGDPDSDPFASGPSERERVEATK